MKQQSINSTRRKSRLNTEPRKDQEVVEEVMKKLAWKQLKEGQWVILAQQWAFTPDQIKAIQHHFTGYSLNLKEIIFFLLYSIN